MADTDNTASATVQRRGDALQFSGALERGHVADLWRRALAQLPGVDRFDLEAVTHVDSAGLALLAELAARVDGTVEMRGDPPGLSELRAAYRLTPDLAYAG